MLSVTRRGVLAFIAGLGLLAGAPLAAQPALTGGEIEIAPPTADTPGELEIAALAGGGFVAVWVTGVDTFARRFDGQGRPLAAAVPLGDGSGVDVATVGSGFVVVGLDDRVTYPLSRARLYDSRGRPLGPPFVVETQATSPLAGAHRAAAEPGGGFAVAWSSAAGIFWRRFSAAGVARGLPMRVGDAGAAASALDLAVSPGGRVLVTWLQSGQLVIRGQLLELSGRAVGPPFQVSVGQSFRAPVGAFLGGGRFAIGWHGETGDPTIAHDGVLLRQYARNGLPRGRPLVLAADIGASYSAPVLAADGQGHAAIGWSGGPTGIQMRELGADGTPGPAMAPRSYPPAAGTPLSLLGSGDGNYLLAWEDHERGTWSSLGLVGQRFASRASAGALRMELTGIAAAEADGPVVLRIERRDGNLGAVSVAYEARALSAQVGVDFAPTSGSATFADGEAGAQEVVLPVLDDALADGDRALTFELSSPTGGAHLVAPVRTRVEVRDDEIPSPLLAGAGEILEVGGAASWPNTVEQPRVAALAGGGAAALWQIPQLSWPPHQPPGIPQLRAVVLDAAGLEVARDFGPAGLAYAPRLVAQPGGGFTLAARFYASAGSPASLVAQSYDSAALPVGTPATLPHDPAAIAARSGGVFVLSTIGQDAGQSLLLTAYGGDGQPVGPASSPAGGAVCANAAPALASDGVARAVVVWKGPGTRCERIFFRRVDAAGRPLGAAVDVDPVAGRRAGRVAAAMAADGRIAIAWEGEGDGDGLGVYARLFDAAGVPLTAALQVNSHRAGDQQTPEVALQGDGRFVVLWLDQSASGRTQVRGQLFAGTGRRRGDDLRLDSAQDGPSEDGCSLSVDAAGRYAAAWRRAGGSGLGTIVVRRLRE